MAAVQESTLVETVVIERTESSAPAPAPAGDDTRLRGRSRPARPRPKRARLPLPPELGAPRVGRFPVLDLVSVALVVVTAALAVTAPGPALLRAAPVLLIAALAVLARRTVGRLEARIEDAYELRNYRLVELLGRGGMGEVWKAEHCLLPRPAAVKLIRPEALGGAHAGDPAETVRRFQREARTTALLSSPHTIEIYDFGATPDGRLCYVMEFLEGLDLETMVVESGPLPPARVVYLLRQVCISLAEAHQRDFIHRDIKPANIYACRKGIHFDFVKVLDFGMVAPSRSATGGETPREAGGTPSYMAPETALGRRLDARADIYSLGCVAYWLLTGCNVFDGDSVEERISHHVHTRPTPPSQRTDRPVPRDLELVVLTCLRKHPDDRIQTAQDLSRRLARCDVGPAWTPGQAMEWWKARRPEPAVRPARTAPGAPRPRRGARPTASPR